MQVLSSPDPVAEGGQRGVVGGDVRSRAGGPVQAHRQQVLLQRPLCVGAQRRHLRGSCRIACKTQSGSLRGRLCNRRCASAQAGSAFSASSCTSRVGHCCVQTEMVRRLPMPLHMF